MKKIFSLIIAGSMIGFASISLAKSDKHEMPKKTFSAEFEKMKTLVGTWKGTSKMGEESHPMMIKYRLTSGGSALVEELGPGTPHEMISVYHDEGKKLTMTHYCALGNQPKLDLKKKTANSLKFSLTRSQKKRYSKEQHMHQVVFAFEGKDKMTQTWTSHKDGKEDMIVVGKLKRVK